MSLEVISHSFPTEIIREILLKATVKSLLRCKSVCKEWYTLISDQHFIKTHYALSSADNTHYAHHRFIYSIFERRYNLNSCPLYDVLSDKSVSSALLLENPLQLPRPREVRIVGSCNGLVCLFVDYEDENDDDYFDDENYYDYDYDDYDDDNVFIYNPSTRIWNRLPFRTRNSEAEWYSFGYDESTDDYKLVEIVDIEVCIYSLKTGKWKNLDDFSCQSPLNGCGIFSNGALHWVAYDSSDRLRIVSLDLAKETYGEVLQFGYDEGSSLGAMDLNLGVLGECLCALCYYYESHADLWVMKVYGVKDSWTKLAFFSCLTDSWIDLYPEPLFISNDGIMLFQSSELVICGLKDSLSPKIHISKVFDACIVVESLVSPFPPLGSGKGKSASMASSTRGEPMSDVSLRSLNSKECNAMTSESYWLSQIRESEKAAMHHISLGFFKLALEAGCQNIKQLRDELESYDCRHNLLGLGESAKQVFQSYHILKQQEKRVNSVES